MCMRCSDKHAFNYTFFVVRYNHRRKKFMAMCAQERCVATILHHSHTYTDILTHQHTNRTLTENPSLLASHCGVAAINQHVRGQWGLDIVGSTVGLGNLQNGQNGHQSPLSFNAAGSVLAPDRVYCRIWGLFRTDKRPGWGAALQPEQNGGLCALKHKYHPYGLKYRWLP